VSTTAQSVSTPGAAPGHALVNGERLALEAITPHTTALDWLRGCGLTGCKEGCAEGECGACAVLVARPGAVGSTATEWVAVNACLVPAAAFEGQELVTAEGLGSVERLHPVQEEMAVRGGSQCGYCTPGFVCAMAAEYYRPGRQARSTEAEPDSEHGPNGFDLHALSGNLCRCTGYRPIKDAAFALGAPVDDDPLVARLHAEPPPPAATDLTADGARFVRPTSLGEALDLIARTPDATPVAGSTDLGVELNLRGSRPSVIVAVDRLDELRGLERTGDEVRLGAALTLSEIERGLGGAVPLLDELFPQFASRLIRNTATLGGNLGTGSPIGDCAPVLLALDASLVLASSDGGRTVPLRDYFTGYRASVRRQSELIREIIVPLPVARLAAFHKIAKRPVDDISSVAVAFAIDVRGGVVSRAAIGLGGVAAMPLRGHAAEELLVGRPWSAETIAVAADALGRSGTPLDDHRASARYRAAMLRQSLLKLHAENENPEEVAP
jgi:xanthine dehydrogenase small subunit